VDFRIFLPTNGTLLEFPLCSPHRRSRGRTLLFNESWHSPIG